MKKLLVVAASLSVLVASTVPMTAMALKSDHAVSDIPDVSGVYSEPGNPKIKVRVSVYHARNNAAKPGPVTPQLTCGIAGQDVDSIPQLPTTGWKLPSSVTYRINPSSVPASVGGANLATITANSFDDWSKASNGKIAFVRGMDTNVTRQANDGQNVIAWGRVSDASALAVTYTRYNTATGQVIDNDTIFNKSFAWYWSSNTDCAYNGVYDAENIMTHELGHWVGLADAYTAEYQNNTMYGYGDVTEVKKDTLTTGDINTVLGIYN